MQSTAPYRARLRARILERFTRHAAAACRQAAALNVFFELSLEEDSLRNFRTLCVLVPHACLETPASLYLINSQGDLRLFRTSGVNGKDSIVLSGAPGAGAPGIVREPGCITIGIFDPESAEELAGALRLYRDVPPEEEEFWLDYARWTGRIMALKQASVGSRQRLTFVNNLIRDIGHNVIVPNMQFKLLFMQMERQLSDLGRRLDELAPPRFDAPDRQTRLDLPDMTRDLLHLQRTISRLFQQSSLFLESLLRRSHFEKGNYDLLLKPCKFKSQVFEPQVERFRDMFRSQDIAIEVDPEVRIDEDVLLEVDVGLMSQVFANLLANALKYTRPMPRPRGAPVKLLRYGWKNVPLAFGSGKPGIRLYVATSGPEIPAEERSRLFEEGFRSAGTEAEGGSGHGLCFVRQIVELHKGRVDYSYEPPMNVFSITLPRGNNADRTEG